MKKQALGLSLLAAAFTATSAMGAVLYEEDFDGNVSAAWNVNLGPTDFTAVFDFDYSTVGIPEAPNSVGNTDATKGLKLYTNEFFNTFGGGSVSPIGVDLGTGDYVMTWDWWQNFHGPAPGGGSGTTQFSYAGIETDGLTANYAGASDSVFFGQTLDGGSGADWRAYSSGATASHQVLDATNGTFVYEASLGGTDNTGRNASNPYYYDRVALSGPFPGTTIPAAQTALFPAEQTGTAQDGITAYRWAEGKITKQGTVVTFEVDGLLIATVDTADALFDEVTGTPTGGTNLLLGHSDTNSGSSTDVLFSTLTFSLFDNVKVEDLVAGLAGDLNNDGFVGIADLNIILGNWNQNVPPGDPAADVAGGGVGGDEPDGFVGIADLNVVLGNWNAGTPPAAAVPEPATLALLGLGSLAMMRRR